MEENPSEQNTRRNKMTEDTCSPALSLGDITAMFGVLMGRLEDIADAIDDNTDAIKNQTTAMQIVSRRRKSDEE